MLVYNPVSKLTFLERLPIDAVRISYSCGTYYAIKRSGGVPRLYYESFRVVLEDGSVLECGRDYLLEKLTMLADEWLRRHLYFMEFDPPGTPLAPEHALCWDTCPLFTTPGRHCKTEEETAWEEAVSPSLKYLDTLADLQAGRASRAFADALDKFEDFERAGHPITTYSPSAALDDEVLAPFRFPTALFDLPTIPGPTDPPGDRIDTYLIDDERLYSLGPDSAGFQDLTQMIKIKPPLQSWSFQALGKQAFGSWWPGE